MPFSKGDININRNGRPKADTKKTVWIMESLQEHGYDYEAMLVKFLTKAAQGNKQAYDMAALLIKLVPHLANAPKNDVNVNQIETLVINRFDAKTQPVIDTTVVEEQPITLVNPDSQSTNH